MYFKNRLEFSKRIKQNEELENATYGVNQDNLSAENNVSAYYIEDVNIINSDDEHKNIEYKIVLGWFHKEVFVGSVIEDLTSLGFDVTVANEKNLDTDFYYTEFSGYVRSTDGW